MPQALHQGPVGPTHLLVETTNAARGKKEGKKERKKGREHDQRSKRAGIGKTGGNGREKGGGEGRRGRRAVFLEGILAGFDFLEDTSHGGGGGGEERGAKEGRDREVAGLGEAGGFPGNPDVRGAAARVGMVSG